MRYYEFLLLEYRRDVTEKRLGQRLLKRNQDQDPTKLDDADQILAQLEQADPSKNHQYTQWIAQRYIAGDFFLEDAEIVRRYLERFVAARRSQMIDQADINRYTLGTLKEKINEIYKTSSSTTTAANSQSSGLNSEALYPVIPGTTVFYNGPQGQFARMDTLEGSINHNRRLGNTAEWCTADSRAERHFNYYHGQGSLYVYVDPQGEKYQFHFETGQYMDRFDRPLSKPMLQRLLHKPEIGNHIDWLAAIKNTANTGFMAYVPRELRNNREFWQELIPIDGTVIKFVPEKFITRQMAEDAVHSTARAFGDIPVEYRTPELADYAVRRHAWSIQDVPPEILDQELCNIAVRSNNAVLMVIPEEFLTEDLLITAVDNDGLALSTVPLDLRSRAVCLAAVKDNGYALEYVPPEMIDREIAMTAIQSNPMSVKFLPDRFLK